MLVSLCSHCRTEGTEEAVAKKGRGMSMGLQTLGPGWQKRSKQHSRDTEIETISKANSEFLKGQF